MVENSHRFRENSNPCFVFNKFVHWPLDYLFSFISFSLFFIMSLLSSLFFTPKCHHSYSFYLNFLSSLYSSSSCFVSSLLLHLSFLFSHPTTILTFFFFTFLFLLFIYFRVSLLFSHLSFFRILSPLVSSSVFCSPLLVLLSYYLIYSPIFSISIISSPLILPYLFSSPLIYYPLISSPFLSLPFLCVPSFVFNSLCVYSYL